MKKLFMSAALVLLSLTSFAGEVTPLNVVEKVSYQIAGLVKKTKIDASYLTDITTLTVTKEANGYKVVLFAPSADQNNPNKLEVPFDLNAKAGTAVATFNSKYPQGPIFTGASVAVLLDLGAEAIVDHLSAAPENIEVARNTQAVDLQKEESGVLMLIHLTDGRAYGIHMDVKGKVLSKGFQQ